MAWEDLSDDDVDRLRTLNEPRLKARQVAELDGRTVARGADVSPGEGEESDPNAMSAAAVNPENPAEVLEFAHRVTWDIYHRDAAASEHLRDQIHELNQRALEQGKQFLGMLDELRAAARQQPQVQPQGRPLSLDDISKLIQVSAAAVREIVRPGS
jgi:hypothetical protein